MIDDTQDDTYQHIAQGLIRESLSSDGFVRLRVISNSMTPLLDIDDFVIIEQPVLQEYTRGDIVVIDRKGEYITHRLVRMGEEKWYTKGDRFHSLDEPVSVDDLVGKVIEIERRDNHVNLKSRKWRSINRIMGWLAIIEVGFYQSARWLRRKIST